MSELKNLQSYNLSNNFFQELGLYERLKISTEISKEVVIESEWIIYQHSNDLILLDKLLNKTIKTELYCKICGKVQVFISKMNKESKFITGLPEQNIDVGDGLGQYQKILDNKFSNMFIYSNQFYFDRYFHCSLHEENLYGFIFLLAREGTLYSPEHTLQKIGQYPSFAELDIIEKEYEKVLGNEKTAELNRAIGLRSHGIGIGSFVYLRRVFEYLILNKFKEKEKNQISMNDFMKLKMDEKIKYLKSELPESIKGLSIIYKLLSKGIHELNEKECKDMFMVVKAALEAIIDEEVEKKKKIEKNKKIEKELEILSQKHK